MTSDYPPLATSDGHRIAAKFAAIRKGGIGMMRVFHPPAMPDPEKLKAMQERTEFRSNLMRNRLTELWREFGGGITWVSVFYTVFNGETIRLDEARVGLDSNAPRNRRKYLLPSAKAEILTAIQTVFQHLQGDPVLKDASMEELEFSWCTTMDPVSKRSPG